MTAVAEVIRGEVVHSLAENEQVISAGLTSFVEVGNALREIRDGRLYHDAGFDTFEDYCKQRWDLSPSRGYQLIRESQVVAVLSVEDLPQLPQNSEQARPLAKLLNERGEEAVVEAWHQIVARHDDEKPITGREVSRYLTQGGNYSGKPSWFELLGEVGDTLIRADKQLAKVEGELRRKPNKAFRDKAGEYAAWAEELAERLRQIESAA